ncbi:N-system amino acid transporter 1, putative [Entamoeba histolytica HM-1:IMSS-B]|uniref:N-system amino acid transporter 1, putative n=6 Tax=Entamoeba histolytica TaxID=5759 RepID=C4LTW0_ENTH1|nr:N-system amino acid transporter 1, putative [Entamoeba histolytica HM-1:IMSS]EMD46099.1 Nsystem amino acid transporter 1, putative [Entamoeba histolytica KU27]EMH75762.1 N-system amino acid transporter 1, putative [Entamoeba histolytica HM-1:IMSS-B]EMS16520.1 N-system amino acid transporter 1, putative [Entamoeba histolytica HM-3:IMSS]ENY62769.1 N-system amino acid transporter 1, putative [Entamoeba histolytica HM-1:IMSS-A]GAT92019.1 n-system amino acid transporter 1 putative [Entamoeba his|eukprot:XP_654178.1 N-system amino acid transporter 1, putative [Entamoeba histolytica HM-1:IMSS]
MSTHNNEIEMITQDTNVSNNETSQNKNENSNNDVQQHPSVTMTVLTSSTPQIEPNNEIIRSPVKTPESNLPVNETSALKSDKKLSNNNAIEDTVAKNFEELLYEEKEYHRTASGQSKRTKKTWGKIGVTSLQLGFSLVGSLIGSGILSLAQTCYKMGIVGYTIWIILTIIYFCLTWTYFNKAIYLTGASTLGELLSLIFGNFFAIIVDICNTLFFICVLMCDQVIATQYIFGIVQETTSRDQWNNTLDQCYGNPQRTAGIACGWHYIILYLVAVCLNLPLIIPKSVKFLSKISVLTLVAAIITTASIIVKLIYAAATGKSSNGSDANFPTFDGKWWPQSFMSFFTMAPFISANFQVHSCLPPLYVGTRGLSKKNKLVALQGGSYFSIITCSLFYLLIAVCGDLSFDKVSSNVLNDFANSGRSEIDWVILICRALMTVVVCIAYPVIMFPTCAGILRYIPKQWKFMTIWNGRLSVLVIRICLLCLTTLAASFITNIGVIFSIGAAIFSIFVVYIGPMSIMMLWPRMEKLGDPNFRKLSVIENVLYNRKVEGNQMFTYRDIETAFAENEAQKNEGIADVVVTINTNETTGQQVIELNDVKEQKERPTNQNSYQLAVTMDGDSGNEDLSYLQKQWIKLPDAHIPWYRYLLFTIAMACCVVLCILSIVGTIIETATSS